MNSSMGKIIVGAVGLIVLVWLVSIILKPKRIDESQESLTPILRETSSPSPLDEPIVTSPTSNVQGSTTQAVLEWPSHVPTDWLQLHAPSQDLAVYYPPTVKATKTTDSVIELSLIGSQHQPENNSYDFLWLQFQSLPLSAPSLKSQTSLVQQLTNAPDTPTDETIKPIFISGISGYMFTNQEGTITRKYYVLPKEVFTTGDSEYIRIETAWADPTSQGYASVIDDILEQIDLYPDKQ